MGDPGNCSLGNDLNGYYMGCAPGQSGAKDMIRHLSRISGLGSSWIRWGGGVCWTGLQLSSQSVKKQIDYLLRCMQSTGKHIPGWCGRQSAKLGNYEP